VRERNSTSIPRSLVLLCAFAATGALSAQTPVAAQAQADQLLVQAADLARRGRLAEAEPLLAAAARLAPTDPRVLMEIAKVEARLHETTAAIEVFRRVEQLEPQAADAHLNLGLALADGGQLPAALDELDAAIALAPQNSEAFLNRGRVLADLGRLKEAAASFAAAAHLAPGHADIFYYWALLATQEGDEPEAAKLFARLVSLQPRNAQASFLLGQSLQRKARGSEAAAAFRRAVALDPENRQYLYALALALRGSRPEESKQLLQRFAQLEKSAQSADRFQAKISSLGYESYIAMQQGDWPTATSLLQEAILACGSCSLAGDLYKNMGLVACHRHDLVQARRELTRALELKPDDPAIVAGLQWVAQQEAARP
jgi:tetratricopeptide (TPR) repeat protein